LLASHSVRSSADVQEVEVSGNLAYCWSILNVEVSPVDGGDKIVRSGSALSILRKQADGAWVMVRDANLLALKS
jgi:ketosteroid isomerase-like protein